MVVARPYGVTADGHAVTEYTLENARGMQVKCLQLFQLFRCFFRRKGSVGIYP